MKLKPKVKLVIFLIILFIIFSMFLYFYYKESSYSYTYEINNISIEENYNIEDKAFKYTIKTEDDTFSFAINGTYSTKRGLISDVKTDENNCLIITGDLTFYPICKNEENYIFNGNLNEEKHTDTFENVEIFDVLEKEILIWNLDHFIHIKDNEATKIDVTQSGVYNINTAVKVGDKLFMPNYDEKQFFSSYYLIDFNTGELENKEIKNEINYDLVYTDYEDNYLNIFDKKNSKEYVVNLKNNSITTKNIISFNEKNVDNSNIRIIKGNYYVESNILKYKYLDFEIILESYNVTEILYQNDKEVVFLDQTTLYYFHPNKGVTKMVTYPEWEFNYKNNIYIH